MILIWDNNGCYSDHEVYFYNCGDWPVEDVRTLAAMLSAIDSGSLVGIVEAVEWEGYAKAPHEALEPLTWNYRRLPLTEEHAGVLRRCPELLEAAVRSAENQRRLAVHPALHLRMGSKERLRENEALIADILRLTKEKK